jgi:group I intron endonuclease
MKIISGIYKIVNTKNDKFYIGSAVDIKKRWDRHKNALKKNKHENIHLQRAYNKYGEDVFICETIEETKDLLLREQHYLDTLKSYDFTIGYNIGRKSSGGDNITNHPHREDIIKRITKSIIERNSKLSDEEKKQKWSRVGNKNFNWKGGVSSPKCDTCGKTLLYGHKKCSLCSKLGENNPFYGKHHSDETKEKLSKINKGKLPPNLRQVKINGIIYNSVSEAARQINVCPATIIFRIKSKYWDYEYYTATVNLMVG